jgi:FkbM family methyltransferase
MANIKKYIQFWVIRVNRYLFKRKFIKVFAGPLKGYYWSIFSNYDYITGTYEDEATFDEIISWLKPDSVFYDIGANIGYYSFIANTKISTGKIYAFEPVQENIEMFNTHLILNRSKIAHQNIVLLPYAISDREQDVSFSNNKNMIEGNTYVNSLVQNDPGRFTVKSFSVDALVAQGYEAPAVLKIDVEGAEFDVLFGASDT